MASGAGSTETAGAYTRGDLGAFRAAAERALALNSRCSYTMAHLGLLFCFSGDWERGLRLTKRAINLCPHHPGWYLLGNFFDEYRRRHYAEALAVHQKINMPDFSLSRYHLLHYSTSPLQEGFSGRNKEVGTTVSMRPVVTS